jgi:uncharacterized membrane protein YkvA (DUF1232 family)
MADRLKDWARAIKRDIHALYLASRDPRVPWDAKAVAVVVVGYALSPILLPLGILLVIRLIPPAIMAEHRAAAVAARDYPVNRLAAVVIVCLWAAAVVATGWLALRYFES